MDEHENVLHQPDLEDIETVVRSVAAKLFFRFLLGFGAFFLLWSGVGLWKIANMDTRLQGVEETRNTKAEGALRDERIAQLYRQADEIKELQREVIKRQRVVETKLGTLDSNIQTLADMIRANRSKNSNTYEF